MSPGRSRAREAETKKDLEATKIKTDRKRKAEVKVEETEDKPEPKLNQRRDRPKRQKTENDSLDKEDLKPEENAKEKVDEKVKKEKKGKGVKKEKLSENEVKVEADIEAKKTTGKSAIKDNAKAVAENGSNSGAAKTKGIKDEPVPRPANYQLLGKGPAPITATGKMYVGCHVSGAGGVWNAFSNAEECTAKSFALFLRNQRQWVAKALDDASAKKWAELAKNTPPHLILPHGSYLMNLGSPKPEGLKKSQDMFLEELQRCEKLGIPHFNFHPGSTLGQITREECCKQIAESINIVHKQTKGIICVLENMSCQGHTVGGDLHELRVIIENVEDKSRVGVCIDTCHAHAAGYNLATEDGFNELLSDFEKIIGWQFLRGLHINDSKGKCGDHKDRHENIGKGTIGIGGFQRIMNCKHFTDLPLILETPWTSNEGYGKEIRLLESLVKS